MHKFLIPIAFLCVALIFGSCEKDPLPETSPKSQSDKLYAPYIESTRGDEKVTLNWGKPVWCFAKGAPCSELEPDHFKILISDSKPSELSLHSKVSNDIFEITIENLENGKPYYFAIKAAKKDGRYQVSETIMTIPVEPRDIQKVFQTVDKRKAYGSWSPNQSSITYERNYTWEYQGRKATAKSVFVWDFANNQEHLIEKNSQHPEWAPQSPKIVYQTDNVDENTSQRATQIAVYNRNDNTTKRLTKDNAKNRLPTWSPNGKWIAFVSDRGDENRKNLWKIPSDSGRPVQLTQSYNNAPIYKDEVGTHMIKKPCWSDDGNKIAFARLKKVNKEEKDYAFDIYTVPSNGGNREPLITSDWDDRSPKFAPDGNHIAYVSDRSGRNEIWLMNLRTKALRQITTNGAARKGLAWSASGDQILFTANRGNLETLYSVAIE